MVAEVVRARRGDGLERAFEQAARLLGITIRRVKGFWHGEVRDCRWSEAKAIQHGYEEWIVQEMRRLEQQRELLAARQQALKDSYAGIQAQVAAGAQPVGSTPRGVVAVDRRCRAERRQAVVRAG